GALHGLLPFRVPGGALLVGPGRVPALGLVPVLAQFVGGLPEADRETGRVRRAQGRGLGDHRPAHRYAEDVGLELHAQPVRGDAAVDLEHVEPDAGVGRHRLDDVAALVADRLQGGPGQVRVGVVPGQPDDRPPRVGPPVRCEQPRERRHEVHAAAVVDLPGQGLALRRAADDAELVAQPLYGRAGDGDGAFQRVHGGLVAEAVADRGEQAAGRADQPGTGVEEHEVAGAVGVLGLAGGEADLPDGGGLLVAEVTGERYRAAERPAAQCRAVTVRVRRRADRRQHGARDVEEGQQLVVPVQGFQVHQHGAAGVGDVGDVLAAVDAAGEVPQQPGVGVAEDRLTAFGVGAYPVDVLQDPLDLPGREVRRRRQPGPAADHLAPAVAVQGGGDAVGTGVLPDDRVVVRTAGAAVPHHRGLPLVGDTERGQVGRAQAARVHRGTHHRRRTLPDLHRVVLDPAGTGQDLFVFELVPADLVTAMVEDHEPGAGGALVDRADEVSHAGP